jgi:tetratricopeptide (TPR) repeat protein
MASGIHPSPAEIERQLDRMLAHPRFKARVTQAEIFAFLVRSALEGQEVTELTLFEVFYSVEEYGNTHVRTMVSYTRGLLKEYYAEDGKDDPVIIALPVPERSNRQKKDYKLVKRPAGEAYTPEFAYNPRAAIAKRFAIAHRLMLGGTTQLEESRKQLQAIEDAEPGHDETALAFAEVTGGQLLLGIFIEEGRAPLIAGLLGLLQMHESTADPWRLHNVRGLLRLCAGEMEEAGEEFCLALALDPRATINRGWYNFYLFVSGRREEALEHAGLVADEDAANAQVQALYGMYLCRAGRYTEAESAFAQALMLDRNCVPAHIGMVQLGIETARKAEALSHAQRLKELVEPEEFEQLIRMFDNARPQDPEH